MPGCARRPESVKIALALRAPILELYRKLDARLRLPQELRLVQSEHVIEELNRRDRRLPNPDNAYGIRFDELDRDLFAKHAFEQRRRHPTGSATTDHDYFLDFVFHDRVAWHTIRSLILAEKKPCQRLAGRVSRQFNDGLVELVVNAQQIIGTEGLVFRDLACIRVGLQRVLVRQVLTLQ